MKIRYFFLLILISACKNDDSASRFIKYYDLKTFTEKLILDLTKQKPNVEKFWSFNGKEETKQTVNVDWEKEFKLFIDADINKSSFVTSYDSVVSSKSIFYKLKSDESLPIKEISVELQEANKPKTISCIKKTENYLFKSDEKIELNLINGRLINYNIRSIQKLLWFSPDTSIVNGKII